MEKAGEAGRLRARLRLPLRVWRGLPTEQGRFCGTGFLVTPTLALTARHVAQAEGAGELYLHLTTMGGFFARIEEVWPHPDARTDVALLRIGDEAAAEAGQLVPFGDPLPIALGDELEALGFADAHSAAEIRSVRVAGFEGAAQAPILQGAHPRGFSGAPALSPDGILRGLVSARDMDKARGYLVPFSSFRTFLEEKGARSAVEAPTAQAEYPAKDEDRARLKRARELLLKWRSAHSSEVESFSKAADLAREWQRRPPTQMTQAVRDLLAMAAEVAGALERMPVAELEFAQRYGLQVHPAVFAGLALFIVKSNHATFGDLPDVQSVETRRMAGESFVPGPYAYEMIARLLESAVALVAFGPDALPLGFVDAAPLRLADFSGTAPLVMVRVRGDEGLRILALEAVPRELGMLVARGNSLAPEAARIAPDGSLDAIATDLGHRYRWIGSAARPSAQYVHRSIRAAAYLRGWSSPAVVLADGSVDLLHRDSRTTSLVPPTKGRCAAAALWQDPLDPAQVRLVRFTEQAVISSVSPADIADQVAVDVSDCLAAAAVEPDWLSISDLSAEIRLSSLDGFPAALVNVRLPLGTVLLFLDPVTLIPIRPARVMRAALYAPLIAADRWLVAAHATAAPGEPTLSVWDLKGPADAAPVPIANDHGVRAEIYRMLLVPEGKDGFIDYFAMLLFTDGLEYRLCRLRWPSRQVETLQRHADLFVPIDRH